MRDLLLLCRGPEHTLTHVLCDLSALSVKTLLHQNLIDLKLTHVPHTKIKGRHQTWVRDHIDGITIGLGSIGVAGAIISVIALLTHA